MGLPSMMKECDVFPWARTAGSVTVLNRGAFGEPQRQEEGAATEAHRDGALPAAAADSLAKEGLCTCLIWRERLQVMAVLL